MAGKKAKQPEPKPGRAELGPNEQILEEQQALQIDARMGDGDRGAPCNDAAAISQSEMRIARAFVGEPAPRRGQRCLLGKWRLAVVDRHLAQDQRNVVGVRRPRRAERRQAFRQRARNFSTMASPIAVVPISFMPSDMMSLVR